MQRTLIIVAFCLFCLLSGALRRTTGQVIFEDPEPTVQVVFEDPELPRVYLDTSYPLNTKPPTFVSTSDALRMAIDNAVPGDTITLDPAATFTGSFELPAKGNPDGKWIIIRSASSAFNSTGMLRPGTRVDGANSAHLLEMPKIRTNVNNTPAFLLAPGANHYRLVGLDLGAADNVTLLEGGLILPAEASVQNYASMVRDVVVDRCYLHGNDDSDKNFRRGVALNGIRMAVIDSYLSNFHYQGGDAQAIWGGLGLGPFKIVNNYLEATGENVMFGGAAPRIADLVPSDIEIQRNLFSRRTSWMGVYVVKNCFELKNARRVLVNGNIFENNWNSEQDGTAIVFKSSGEGGCGWCVTEHVTFTNNIVRHAANGLVILGIEPRSVNHVKIENVLFYDLSKKWSSSAIAGRRFLFDSNPGYEIRHVKIIHTTATSEGGAYILSNTEKDLSSPYLTFRDNIVERRDYGIRSGLAVEGKATLERFFNPYDYKKNLLVNTSDDAGGGFSDDYLRGIYPCGVLNDNCPELQTFVAPNWDAVQFVDRLNGNYRLAPTSPYRNQASDGKNIGADQDAIEAAIRGVHAGDLVISEFRLRGANGANDEFVELFNNTNFPITVTTVDGSHGWSLVASDGTTVFTIPNGTVIPSRTHYLAVNSNGYSLANYGGAGAATGDLTFTTNIADNSGLALFRTAQPAYFTPERRLDAAGFGSVANNLYREGSGLSPVGGVATNAEISFVRKLTSGFPQDTGDNAADFFFISTTGGVFDSVTSILGAPGPQNRRSPLQYNSQIKASLLDPLAAANASPNWVRVGTPVTNGQYGTLSLRRKYTNRTGQTVTRLRFRVADVTTFNSPGPSTQADMRLLSSPEIEVLLSDNETYVPVSGMTLEQPPSQSFGGGLNSSVNAGSVSLNSPLPSGASVNVQFLLGVQRSGSYRFLVNVEAAVPAP